MECTLYLAEGCNLQCRYCYEGNQKKNRMMDKETVEHTLEYITQNVSGNEKIHLFLLGGEPLLNKPAFFHVMDTIQNRYSNIREKFSIEITTNGTLLDEDIMKIVKDEKIDLSISIDGKKETNEMNRVSLDGKENFPVILKNINKMIMLKIPFNIRMTVSNNNVKKLYENVQVIKVDAFGHILCCPATDYANENSRITDIANVQSCEKFKNILSAYSSCKSADRIPSECENCSVEKYCQRTFCGNCIHLCVFDKEIIKYLCNTFKYHYKNLETAFGE